MTNVRALSILHISDLHLKTGDPYDRNVVVKALNAAVARFRKQGRYVDLIMFTGDIAFSGNAAEYELATTFFDQFLAAAGVTKERLYVIPGNHDVDRRLGEDLKHTLESEEESVRYFAPHRAKAHFAKLEAYCTWHDRYFTEEIAAARRLSAAAVSTCQLLPLVNVAGLCVSLLAVNTALFCQGDDDQGKLWVGRRCLDETLDSFASNAAYAGADLRISLLHHPFDWLHSVEQTQIRARLRDHSDLILRGHLHESDADAVAGATGATLQIAAGAIYQTRKWQNRALWLTIAYDATEVRVLPLRYEDSPRPVWTVDTSQYPNELGFEGRFENVQWKKLRSSPLQSQMAPAESSMSIPVHMQSSSGLTAKRAVGKILCADQPMTKFFHGRVEQYKALSNFFHDRSHADSDKITAICGQGGEGKTTLALQYWALNKEKFTYAFFVRADSEENLKADYVDILRVLEMDSTLPPDGTVEYKAVLDNYESDAATFSVVLEAVKGWMTKSDRYIIIIDNADFCEESERTRYLEMRAARSEQISTEDFYVAQAVSNQMTQSEFKDYLPSHLGGCLLLTSRNTRFDGKLGINKTIGLWTYSWNEGAEFLAHRATGDRDGLGKMSEENRAAIIEISNLLGKLPLALEQAGAYINSHHGAIREYLSRLRQRIDAGEPITTEIELSKPEAGEYHSNSSHASVALTYDISIEAISAKRPAAVCALHLCAFCSANHLSRELFFVAADSALETKTDSVDMLLPLYNLFCGMDRVAANAVAYNEIEDPLTRYSLLEIRHDQEVYTMHRVLQDVIRYRLSAGERKAWGLRVASLMLYAMCLEVETLE